ncbi:ABC-type transport auxiliary lipoprotein family protein [Facilibium subflavum]|uniref:ABC-type transport auxiliary lipoprotein family protein n=1 Tax=Facilibium subflavum TaxID=2219058 RepID=UPI000E65AA83|nr:ABC-type transport auxiliary lipoprotein family protein [Facilibium subflavum]
MSKYKRLFFYFAIPGLAISLAGCSGLLSPVNTPPIHYYQISANLDQNATKSSESTAQNTTQASSKYTLFITTLTANQPYSQSNMYYRQTPYQLSSYEQSQWISSPNQMLTQTLTQYLLNDHQFGNVVSSNFIGYADYRLTGNLNQLIQKAQQGAEPIVFLSVTYTLTNAATGKIIDSKTFRLQTPSKASAASFADSANTLSNKLVSNVGQWLSRSLKAPHST